MREVLRKFVGPFGFSSIKEIDRNSGAILKNPCRDRAWEELLKAGVVERHEISGVTGGGLHIADRRGILRGVGGVIEAALHLKHGYERKKSCRKLSGHRIENFNAGEFVSQIYKQLELNCAERLPTIRQSGKPPGPENWRWKPLTDFVSRETRGLEVPFERLIATVATLPKTKEFDLRNWTNQMPVASGLTKEKEGGRRIDLVHRCKGGDSYDFIELKTSGPDDSDNPLHAAMEILIYGLAYVYSRAHR